MTIEFYIGLCFLAFLTLTAAISTIGWLNADKQKAETINTKNNLVRENRILRDKLAKAESYASIVKANQEENNNG